MSNKALNWAFQLDLKSGPKFVLVALADYADEADSCYPSYDKISKKTGIGKRAIANHMAALEELGLVTREELRYDDGRRSGFRFRLNLQILQVAKNDLATCKKRPSHLQNMQDNNPYTNHQIEPLEKKIEKKPRKNKETTPSPIPEGYPDSQALQDGRGYLAKHNRMDLEGRLSAQAEAFALHHAAKGSKFKDWHLAWLKWLRQFMEYNPAQSEASGRVSVSEYLKNRGAA